MFIKSSYIKQKLRNLSFMIFNFLENNNDCRFDRNGERNFIDKLFIKFMEKPNKKRIIFDIGGNVGDYSKIILDNAEKNGTEIELHIFEPTEACFNELKSQFNKKTNVFLNNFGVSNAKTSSRIYYDKEKSGLASLYQRNLDSYSINLDNSEEILLEKMEDYIKEKKISHIDFVKIDIEGHELKAFDGFGRHLRPDFVDYIQFEYGGANLDSNTSLMELYVFFEEKGFKIAKVMPKGLEIRKYSPIMENYNNANYVAISKDIF